jgi:hypothetical protein
LSCDAEELASDPDSRKNKFDKCELFSIRAKNQAFEPLAKPPETDDFCAGAAGPVALLRWRVVRRGAMRLI